MLQVPSRCTREPHTLIHNHLLPTYKLHVCPNWGVVCMVRVHIWALSLRPLSCLSTQKWVCACAYMHVISPVCVAIGSLFLHGHLHHAARGRALSCTQESLWEWVWEGFRERMCKAVRWICVHHSCIWPQGLDRRSEQRVSTKEHEILCRVHLTYF